MQYYRNILKIPDYVKDLLLTEHGEHVNILFMKHFP